MLTKHHFNADSTVLLSTGYHLWEPQCNQVSLRGPFARLAEQPLFCQDAHPEGEAGQRKARRGDNLKAAVASRQISDQVSQSNVVPATASTIFFCLATLTDKCQPSHSSLGWPGCSNDGVLQVMRSPPICEQAVSQSCVITRLGEDWVMKGTSDTPGASACHTCAA